MVCRIAIFLILFFSVSLAQEVKISNVGSKDFSQFMGKDFTFTGELENFFILEDLDQLSYLYFKGFYDEMDIEKLKQVLSSIKDKNLRSQLEFDFFEIVEKRYGSANVLKIFNDIVFDEKLRLLLSIKYKYYESKFDNPIFNVYLKSYQEYENGKFNEAINELEPYKFYFPNTYVFYLLANNEISRARESIQELEIEDKDLIYYVDYLSGQCDRILNDKVNLYNYGLELMKIDCSLLENKNYEIPQLVKQVPERLENDDFKIIKLFLNNKLLSHDYIYPFFQTYYFRWKLLSYITFLENYLQDIKLFKKRLKELKKEFQVLKDRYHKSPNISNNAQEDEPLKRRFVELEELVNRIQTVETLELAEIDMSKLYYSIVKSYGDAKKELITRYHAFLKFLEEEEKKLSLEVEFLNLDRIIKENKSNDPESIEILIRSVDKLIEEGETKNVSYLNKAYYNKIYLLWNKYLLLKNIDEKKRKEKLSEIIFLIKKYISVYRKINKDIYLILAEANDHLGDSEEALRHYENFMYMSSGKDVPARVYVKIGDIYFDKKNYGKARESYLKARDSTGIYKILANYKIAWTYYLEENFMKALDLLLNEDIYKKEEISQILLDEIIELIAKTFYKMKEDFHVHKILNKANTFPYPERVFKALGDIYVSFAEYEKALEIYEKGLKFYYQNYYSFTLLASKVELLTFLGREEDSYQERLRFNNLYKKGSLYYEKFNAVPYQYEEMVLTAGYYYADKYETTKNPEFFNKAVSVLLDYLYSLPESKRSGEVNFLLGQLYFENLNYEKASQYYLSAYFAKFKEEESIYGYINCLYYLWEKGKVGNDFLIREIERYITNFINSYKSTKISLILSDLYIKDNNQKTALNIIDDLIKRASKEHINLIVEYLSNRFEEINDKIVLSNLFERCYERDNVIKYKELKHLALFIHAQQSERNKNFEDSKKAYLSIVNDLTTRFRQPALYNLAILESESGNRKKALEILKNINEGELEEKALEFMFSMGYEWGYFEFSGEAAEKIGIIKQEKEMLFRAVDLYIRAKNLEAVNRTINLLSRTNLNDIEKEKLLILKGVYFYYSEQSNKSIEIFEYLLRDRKFEGFDYEKVSVLYEIFQKTIFSLPDSKAKDFLENFIELCTFNYKRTGYVGYKYFLGSVLTDYSIFFVNRKEAIEKGIEIFKSGLRETIEMEDNEMTAKLMSKIRETVPEIKNKKFILPPIEIEEEIEKFLQE